MQRYNISEGHCPFTSVSVRKGLYLAEYVRQSPFAVTSRCHIARPPQKTQVSASGNAGICIRQRRYLRWPMRVSAMRDEDEGRDSVTVYYIYLSRKWKLTYYIVSEFPVIWISYIYSCHAVTPHGQNGMSASFL